MKKNYGKHHAPLLKRTKRIMKIASLCNLLAVCSISAASYAQELTYSINKQNSTMIEVFKEIEKNTDYTFFYNDNKIDVNREVSVSASNAPIEEILSEVLENTNYSYKIIDKQILIQQSEGKLASVSGVNQNKKKITGKVLDSAGMPIIGANVIEKGTSSNGTITDIDGNFSLEVDANSIIVVSYIGYSNQEVKVGNKSNFSIALKEDTKTLDEVVVVGYGTQKKVNLTGAVSSVTSEKLENRPLSSVSEGLQGTMPGVTITRSSGEVGQNPSIKVRGFSSLNSGGALIIVDGVPGNMNNISPNDIETISILKDAASSSIYGARAAEGVILITTKTGKESEKIKIQYSNNFGFNTPTRLPEPTNSYEGAVYANLAFTNAGGNPLYPEWMMEKFKDPSVTAIPYENQSDYYYVADFNWWNYFFNKSFQQTQNISLSGGSKYHKFMISGSWLDQNGYFSKWGPDNYDRITFRVNLSNHIIPEKLTLDTNLSLVNADKDSPSAGYENLMYYIMQAGSSLPLYNPDGTYARYRMQQSPMQLLKDAGFNNSNVNRFEGRVNLKWNIYKDLTLSALGGYNIQWDKSRSWQRAYYKYRPSGPSNLGFVNQPNKLTEGRGNYKYYIAQLQANYSKQIGKHFIGVLAGTSVEESTKQNLSTYRSNILGNELPSLGLGEAESARNSLSVSDDWGLVSAFARVNYNFDEKYLLEANVRADGSSRFSDAHKWGIFPSFSVGWRMTEEKFMKNQKVFSNLKLRASYGELGNQNGLGLYDHVPVYKVDGSLISFPGGAQQQIYAASLPSSERTWETIKSYNIGLEMGFFNNRLSLEGEYFRKTNEDMLINISLPSIIGIDVPTGNYGELMTKGWEFSAHWNDIIESIGLKYHIDFNIYDQTDKLTDLATSFAKPTAGIQNIQGYPINAIFAYEADGYFKTQEEVNSWAFQHANTGPGDIRYIDQTGDDIITSDDVVYIGTTTPRFCYGINLGAEWKGFDLTMFFQGVGKRKVYLDNAFSHPYQNAWDNYAFKDVLDYWTPENQDARFPRPHQGGHNYLYSTHWLQNASYIRLKNLQLGYTIPKNIVSKLKLDNLRLYFSGENLWEYTSMMMFDPETNGSGVYPLNRSLSFGLSLTY